MGSLTPTSHGRTSLAGMTASIALLVTLTAIFYWPAVSGVPFYTKGEPREAIVVQSILDNGSVVLPLRNGTEIPSKPPLFHWLGAVAALITGTADEMTVRLPSLGASLGAIALTVVAGWHAYGMLAGLLAGVVLATTQQWFASSTTARVDMVLTAAIAAALLSSWRALALTKKRLPASFFLFSALAVLAKGPVGYVLPALVVLCYVAYQRERGMLAFLRPPPAAWFLVLPLAWYFLAWTVGGQAFLDKLLFKENIYRVFDPDAVAAGHVHGPLYYVPALLGGFAPWSLLLPAVAIDTWRTRRRSNDTQIAFPVVWIVVTLLVYSVAGSKRGVYLLSAYPALALLTGRWLAWNLTPQPAVAGKWRQVGATTLAVAMGLPALIVGLEVAGVPVSDTIMPLLSRSDAANLEAVTASLTHHSGVIFFWAAGSLTLAYIVRRTLLAGRRSTAFVCATVFVTATELLISLTFHRDLARSQTIAPLMATVRREVAPTDVLYFYRHFEYSAVFYAHRSIPVIDRIEDLAPVVKPVWFLLQAGDAEEFAKEIFARWPESRGKSVAIEEMERFDFHGNRGRQPLILVQVTRMQSHEQPR